MAQSFLTPVVHSSFGGWPVASGAWFSETFNGTNPSGHRYEFIHAAAAPLP